MAKARPWKGSDPQAEPRDEILKVLRSIERGLMVILAALSSILGIMAGAVLVAVLSGCAMTTGDPYGDGVPCYEGPLIIEKITPTPTPNTEGDTE